ncbi:Zinc finger and SCAN domain-containing protein 22 [Papilio machaon]|uniref:Zinc finger and SCAN domain-containing protein 22 n=1 Tax=Papilio machaon TaxID=76193 RepID=A0A0N1PFK9_PAPMA|nr:Zinc finger and SCAN domain-containing protein 22 [Papilio machaon]
MEDNIKTCCRICLDVESKHVSIFEDPVVLLHIKSCLSINVNTNDDLPKEICVVCISQLCDFYNFQQNARCSQDWLESSMQSKTKKSETKTYVQPLPDSEYNSDSLLEFLNNTANIEEYLNNLGKEDIPSIVSLLDKTSDHNIEFTKTINKVTKQASPKKRESPKTKKCIKMDIDVLDSDVELVKEILFKETEPKTKSNHVKNDKTICFGCKAKFDNVQKLSQHLCICESASRTCIHCNVQFESKKKMKKHSIIHGILTQMICNCGKQFTNKELLLKHYNSCQADQVSMLGLCHRCKQCGVIFKDRLELYKHVKQHLIKSAEKICDICGHTFIGNDRLAKHKKEEHEKLENLLYRCKICNKISGNHKEMYMHVQNHTKQVASSHLCESCGHSFATKATLLRHSLQHAAQTDHQCSFCSKKFPDAKSKYEHQLKHSEIVMCDKCGEKVDRHKLECHMCV